MKRCIVLLILMFTLFPVAASYNGFNITITPSFRFDYQVLKDTPLNKNNVVGLDGFTYFFDGKLEAEFYKLKNF